MKPHPTKKRLQHRRFIIPTVVSESILIDIVLKIFRAYRMICARNTTLGYTLESF
jgi:hypothetical protein